MHVPNEIQKELAADEELVWAGKPLAGVRLKRSDAALIPFSIMFGGSAFVWEALAWSMDAPLMFRLWGVPFVLIGLYLIVGRFFIDAKLREHSVYALTARRAIIVSGLWFRSVRSIELCSLSELGFVESAGGVGTITFGAANPFVQLGRRVRPTTPQFESLPDARGVYELARSLHARTGLRALAHCGGRDR